MRLAKSEGCRSARQGENYRRLLDVSLGDPGGGRMRASLTHCRVFVSTFLDGTQLWQGLLWIFATPIAHVPLCFLCYSTSYTRNAISPKDVLQARLQGPRCQEFNGLGYMITPMVSSCLCSGEFRVSCDALAVLI